MIQQDDSLPSAGPLIGLVSRCAEMLQLAKQMAKMAADDPNNYQFDQRFHKSKGELIALSSMVNTLC